MSDVAIGGAIGTIVLLICLSGFIISCLFLYTLHKALKNCAEENRRMKPGLVWLSLIPFFSFVWNFFVVARVDQSLEAEYAARGLAAAFNSTRAWGLAYAILAISVVLPVVGPFLGVVLAVCWIVYWVKVAGLSRRLGRMPEWAPVGRTE